MPPSITYYSNNILQHEYFTVQGSSTIGTNVILSLKDDQDNIVTQKIAADNQGSFTIIWPTKLSPEMYTFHVEAEDARGAHSLPTNDLQVLVRAEALAVWSQNILPYIVIGIVLIIIIFGLGVIAIYMWYTLKKIKQRMAKKALISETNIHKSFNVLLQDVREHIKALHAAKSARELSDEENAFIKTMSSDLKEAEDFVNKQIKNISKR